MTRQGDQKQPDPNLDNLKKGVKQTTPRTSEFVKRKRLLTTTNTELELKELEALQEQNREELLEKEQRDIEKMTPAEIAKKTAIIGDSIGVRYSNAVKGFSKEHQVFPVASAMINKTWTRDSGKEVTSIRDQLDKVDPRKHPFLVIEGGTNNLPLINGPKTAQETAEKLLAIAKEAKERGFKKVIVINILPHKNSLEGTQWEKRAKQFNKALETLAKEQEIAFFDLRKSLLQNRMSPTQWASTFLSKGDVVHPNRIGAKLAAASIISGVQIAALTPPESWENAKNFKLPKEAQELLDENPAGTLQLEYATKMAAYMAKAEKLRNTTANSSIEQIRYERLFEQDDKNLNTEERRTRAQNETVQRLVSYTDYTGEGEYKQQWFTLNYNRIDKLKGKSSGSHEYGVGLGDILLDPDIKDILVQKANGDVIEATRGEVKTGKHEGRYGFVDKHGEYVATLTNDKFRILSTYTDTELIEEEDKDEFLEKYKNNLDEENNVRKTHRLTYQEYIRLRKINVSFIEPLPEGQEPEVFVNERQRELGIRTFDKATQEDTFWNYDEEVAKDPETGEALWEFERTPEGKPNEGKNIWNFTKAVCKTEGINPYLMWAVFQKESYYSPFVGSSHSSATGLGQMINGTWKEYFDKHIGNNPDPIVANLRKGQRNKGTELANPRRNKSEEKYRPKIKLENQPESYFTYEAKRYSRCNPYLNVYTSIKFLKDIRNSYKNRGMDLNRYSVRNQIRLVYLAYHEGSGGAASYLKFIEHIKKQGVDVSDQDTVFNFLNNDEQAKEKAFAFLHPEQRKRIRNLYKRGNGIRLFLDVYYQYCPATVKAAMKGAKPTTST
ncbi:hypothetical protein HOE67_04265 [Candidatus Peregrinibacteria bacterium]|jgi:lysophospholipase L1-like esterase|nr:hypothetical protein [Candidatus Peregrinibacteria bacterium]MBT4056297.1 hypothetical protein [Candidatus Peregrinibacteria bacterium]